MKVLSCWAWPKFILWAAVVWALEGARLFPGASSTAWAADSSGQEVRLTNEKMAAGGLYQFSFQAGAGQIYPIGMSLDLVNWSVLTNLVGTGGVAGFTDLAAPQSRQRFYQIGVPFKPTNMVLITPGTFTMGSAASEVDHKSTEAPQTVVTLTRKFWMGQFEVSQQEYFAVTGTNIQWFTPGRELPADSVSWPQATNYCRQLTERERAAGRLPTGYVYRLPTEAEWEYACRGGTTTPFGIGDGRNLSSTQANFDGTFPYGAAAPGPYLKRSTYSGSYQPNAWGLYDMHGNMWEWCQDWYAAYPGGSVTDPKGPATGSERVLRGGGYPSVGQGCRSAARDSRAITFTTAFYGFRVVLGPQ